MFIIYILFKFGSLLRMALYWITSIRNHFNLVDTYLIVRNHILVVLELILSHFNLIFLLFSTNVVNSRIMCKPCYIKYIYHLIAEHYPVHAPKIMAQHIIPRSSSVFHSDGTVFTHIAS
jgi:hypothetical protein